MRDPRLLSVVGALARGAVGDDLYRPELPGRMLDTLDLLAATGERDRLLGLLRALGTRPGALALTGRPLPVSWMRGEEAEELLQRWSHGRVGFRRAVADAVIQLALQAVYAHEGPAWEDIGYPGPLGPPPRAPRRLEPLRVEQDERLSCDAVVVGSGAGGGAVAAVLAGAGLDVVVLERGGYRSEADFHHREGEAMRELYLYGMTLSTTDRGVIILAGQTLGGGTTVNYTTSFRTPEHVRRQWYELSGVEAFVSGEFEECLDEAAARLGVNTDSSAAGRRDALIEEGLKKLGWHVDMLPRAVRGCTQDEQCGYCGFGCRVGAKQSTMRTYLEDAAARGARLVVEADVERVLIDEARATGVVARCGPHRLEVAARAVVVCAGAIETPALLLRSGLRRQVGRNLHLHPGHAAWGVFDDEVRMWEGTLQARYSNQFRGWDGGYGPIFETVPVHPGGWATALPWTSASGHRKLMADYPNLGLCAVLPRDASSGRVTVDRAGQPRVSYRLGRDDERRLAEGVVNAARVLEAAGARRISTLQRRLPTWVPSHPGGFERFAEEVRAHGFGGGRATLASYHQMGSARMGVDPATSVVGADNESHEVCGLYVADASTFPNASGVNPMLSIYGIALRAGRIIAGRLA